MWGSDLLQNEWVAHPSNHKDHTVFYWVPTNFHNGGLLVFQLGVDLTIAYDVVLSSSTADGYSIKRRRRHREGHWEEQVCSLIHTAGHQIHGRNVVADYGMIIRGVTAADNVSCILKAKPIFVSIYFYLWARSSICLSSLQPHDLPSILKYRLVSFTVSSCNLISLARGKLIPISRYWR